MRSRFGRPSPSLVISLVALFVALGGTSYAAISITGKNVKDGSLTGKDIKKSSLGGANIKDKSLSSKDFSGSVKGSDGAKGATGATGAPGTQGPQGTKGDKGDKGDAGPSQIFYDKPLQTSLTAPNAGAKTIATVTLPAGTWHVEAKVILQDSNGGETDCFIRHGSSTDDSFYTNTSAASQDESMYGGAVIGLTAASTAVEMACNSLSTGNAIAANPLLTATQVGAATAQ